MGKRRVWYKFADRVMRDARQFQYALNYIHINPIKHRNVNDPYQWPWFSVHDYLDTRGRQSLHDQWQLYPPGDFGQGWDD
jgi:hypothetical protein